MSQNKVAEKNKPATPSMRRMHAEVLIDGNTSMGSYVTEGEDRFIIGSSKRADLVVPHAAVSQIHAMLRLVKSDIVVYDLGSEGGTFVEGKKIVERKLNPGEFFEIGGHRVRVNLLDQVNEKHGEQSLFWMADCSLSPDRLEVLSIEDQIVREERSLAKGARLHFGRGRREILVAGAKPGGRFLHRKDSGSTHVVEAALPPGFVAEIYNGSNEVIRLIEQEGSAFTFSEREKVRMISADQKKEILILWQAQGFRVARATKDAESPVLKKTLGSCLAVALFLLTVLSYVPLKKETVEEALLPATTSYERTSMDSAPAAQQQSEQSEEPAQASKAASISSSLSKLLNKKSALTAESIQQAISNNGTQTSRNSNLKNANIQSQDIASGAVGGGAVNVNALSAGLSNGSGKAGSLKGFANGKGTSVGSGGFGGKGFDMSLGGDEAEALGGLDKSLIAAVVQSNIGQIKHCYERQLIVDPNVFGKVVAAWTINKDGGVSVSSIKKTTMNNKAVENCIAGKIKNWNFPKPKGGGQVLVSYPFLFKSLN